MKKIIRNGREYLRFKIGDEFTAVSGKGSFNKMKKEGLCSEEYNEELGFIYPFYDGSTLKNHIKGYSLTYNHEGKYIKVAKDGAGAGSSILIKGKTFNAGHSYYLKSNLSNEYISLYFNNYLPEFQQGTSIPSVKFNDYKNEYIEIPSNHKELSKVIKRVNEYKQLSKQLSKQMEDYKKAILQESEKAIKYFKETNQHDKYIRFKIGDEFTGKLIDARHKGRASQKDLISSNNFSKEKNDIFKYPVYDASVLNNHIKGYSDLWNDEGLSMKQSVSGDAGKTKLIKGKYFLSSQVIHLVSKGKIIPNEYISYSLNKWIPKYNQGSTIINNVFSYYKNEYIEIPVNHQELSKKIEEINKWQIQVKETTKKMEKYIDGVLQMSLK